MTSTKPTTKPVSVTIPSFTGTGVTHKEALDNAILQVMVHVLNLRKKVNNHHDEH